MFTKLFKVAADDAKLTIGRAIKNNVQFSCQLVNICSTVGEEIQYPDNVELSKWIKNLFAETFVPKPLNEKALAMMKAKGLSVEKQSPRDLFLIVVTGSDTHVNLGVSIPGTMADQHDVDDFVKCVMKNYENYSVETTIDSSGKFVTVNYQCEYPLKERDVILQCAFNELKKRKIYVDDDDDDVIYDIENNTEE
jgi:hypothetical protein